ncbi:hypothetical protein [Roseimicrobium sp. ORNL1]|uniref:hypothetical protein n=1 Tax=Roseimicrobium sp. ORNL1 TaxID=2711231 RepID=UPI0013E19040|nr:hypothetical protein [Roseimicrobium sp. ORNL1]QIF02497.1 hypothetical protein G5S37_13490 [Roseimicrobium sp. ORNL1]
MEIPQYWASAEDEVNESPKGPLPLKCFGWSDENLTQARSRASETLQRLMDRIRSGAPLPEKYLYASRPIREEILETMTHTDGGTLALITRNGYGAAVLNTPKVMFADIDDPTPPPESPFKQLLSLFTKTQPAKAEPQLPALVTSFAASHPDWSIRCYRTFAGWRLLMTHETFEPTSPESREILQALGSDPQYIDLTRAQECFRARLTPKPWRCGVERPNRSFPRETPAAENAHMKWLTGYERASSKFATCRYVQTLGSTTQCPEAQLVVLWHDRITRASESALMLA